MEVEKQDSHFYFDDPMLYYQMDRFKELAGDFVLVQGYGDFGKIDEVVNRNHGKKIVFIDNEMPNFLQVYGMSQKREWLDRNHFWKVLCICPYTCAWRNKMYNEHKYSYVYLPINEEVVPANIPYHMKSYDVVYSGHVVSDKIQSILDIISKYNYRFITHDNHHQVTNQGVSYKDKLSIIGNSKIFVINNLLFPNPDHLNGIKCHNNWQDNEAFKMINTNYQVLPQLKTRVFEAAISGTLMLVKRDPWNLIEDWFIPGKEFVYYDSEFVLKQTIDDILSNDDKYSAIANRAMEKAEMEYTTDKYFNRYLRYLT